MKRITTNDDIRFPISVIKGLDSDVFTIRFYTTSKAIYITKTNEDVEDGIIHLEWTELSTIGTGVMNYTVLIPEEDGSFSDDTFNSSISGTTIFYIVSNIILPDDDDTQELLEIVSDLQLQLNQEITRSTGKDSEHDTALAGKANKNGSASESFNTYTLNLRREGANTSLYNYNLNGEEYVSFYDQTGGSLTYHFTPNQSDDIATVRQLNTKANFSDVYTKSQIDLFLEGSDGILEEPTEKLPKYSTSHPIRILGIGNSYMTEGTRELVGFLTAEGLTEDEIDLEIAYYPARTLEAWYEAIRDGGGYEQLVQFKYNASTHEWYRTAEHNVANIRDTISGKSWDLIILQEFPSFNNSAPNASEYYSYYETLASTITLCKSLCPNDQVQFGWHMIWSNDQYIANNYSVWEKIGDACMRTAKLSDVSFVIPSGTALQNAYNTTPFRGYEHHFLLMDQIGHPAAGAARYIISATWFESLIAPIFGRTLIGNGYVPTFTSDGTVTYQDAEVAVNSGNVLLAKYCAYSSVFDKYDVNYELEKELNLHYTKAETDTLLGSKANSADVYSKTEANTLLNAKANSADVYTKSETYTKSEVNTALSGKANKNGSSSESFTTRTLNLQREGASTSLYNYKNANDEEFVSFYDQTGGSLSYKFTANQGDNIATERQVNAVSGRVTTLENAGYITTETDPTVPSWAKQQNKPTYTASEVGALPDSTVIPSKTSDLTNDSGFVTGSKIYVGTCGTAAATNPKICTVETFPTDSNGKPIKGTVIAVKFTYTNSGTTNRGLNVNGCGSASVWYNTGVTTTNGYYGTADRYITYMWDGTYWVWQGWSYDTNTTYSNVSLGQGYAVQNNSSASSTITATLSSYALTTNGIVSVKFTYDVPANATLNINSKGAKAIYNRDAAIQANVIKAGDTATFIYNTYYRLISVDRWQNNSGGGSGDGKQMTILYLHDNGDGTCYFTDENGNTLSIAQSQAILVNSSNDLVVRIVDENDDPNFTDYRLSYYYYDTDYYNYYLTNISPWLTEIRNIWVGANPSSMDAWEFSIDTAVIPAKPQKLGFGYATQSNSSGSAINATVQSGGFVKYVGGMVAVKFTKDVLQAATLNVGSTGSYYIYYRGAFIPKGVLGNGDIGTFVFTTSNTWELISIIKNASNDAVTNSWIVSGGNLQAGFSAYKTYLIPDYSTALPSGTTGCIFTVTYNPTITTEPVTTIILRADDYSNIDWSALNISFVAKLVNSSTTITMKWKNGDPTDAIAHLGAGYDFIVIKVYEGQYGSWEAW